MLFAFIVLLVCVPVRRAGWALSRYVLYQVPLSVSVFGTIFWASLIAYLLHVLIRWQDPNIFVKILFAYGFGAYLSIPNFQLFALSTLPPEEVKRTAFIYSTALLSFSVLSVTFTFWKPQ